MKEVAFGRVPMSGKPCSEMRSAFELTSCEKFLPFGAKKVGNVWLRTMFIDQEGRALPGGAEMTKLSGIALKRARLVPSAVFASPAEVVRSAELSRAQKIAILRRWEFDARPAAAHPVARPDGLILDQIRKALVTLGAAPPARRAAAPTRH